MAGEILELYLDPICSSYGLTYGQRRLDDSVVPGATKGVLAPVPWDASRDYGSCHCGHVAVEAVVTLAAQGLPFFPLIVTIGEGSLDLREGKNIHLVAGLTAA